MSSESYRIGMEVLIPMIVIGNMSYSVEEILQQFYEIPQNFDDVYIDGMAMRYSNAYKNRYEDILPLENTVFRLRQIDEDIDSVYINANVIEHGPNYHRFISTQAPLFNTIQDFWRMTWESNSTLILMLTNLIENGITKADRYWPYHNVPYQCGNLTINFTEEENISSDISIRKFGIWQTDFPHIVKNITQVHCIKWADFGVPNSTAVMEELVTLVNRLSPEKNSPIVIHCSAGVGRTGTYLALTKCIEDHHQGKEINIKETVTNLRKQRKGMVQSASQYLYIFQALSDLLLRQ
jgi:protein tyrosine phosphatase